MLLSSQKYGFGIRDPISGIRKKPISDPDQKDTGSGSSTLEKAVKKERKVYYLGVEICLLLLCSEDGFDPARRRCQASVQP
jgi:hypothetical protein